VPSPTTLVVKNGSKMRSRTWSGMPMPWSTTPQHRVVTGLEVQSCRTRDIHRFGADLDPDLATMLHRRRAH
jgi:hypothetical protein